MPPTFRISLVLIALALPLSAQDSEAPAAAPEVFDLELLDTTYKLARQTGFGPGAALDELRRVAGAFLETNPDAPAIDRATAHTYLLRCLLSEGKWKEVISQSAEVLATEGLKKDDAFKLHFYRGYSAVQLGDRAMADEHEKALAEINPEIAGALHAQILKAWPLVVVGKPAPEWKLPRVDAEGEEGMKGELALTELRGKYVLLDFWATWCGPCRGLMEAELAPLHTAQAANERFALVSVGANWRGDTAAKQAEFAKSKDYHWTKVFDEAADVTSEYGIEGIPTLTFIDPDGKVLAHGYATEVLPLVKDTLAKLEAPGKEPQTEEKPAPQTPAEEK